MTRDDTSQNTVLRTLPAEILIMTLRNIGDPTTLLNLLIAYSFLQPVFARYYIEILDQVLQNDQSSEALSQNVSIAMAGCLRRFSACPSDRSTQAHTEFSGTALQSTCPFLALRELVKISQDIDGFITGFANFRLRQVDSSANSSRYDIVLSYTEQSRLRRAFWNLQAYFDLFHHLNPENPDHQNAIAGGPLSFVQKLYIWELEEVECAYVYLNTVFHELELRGDQRTLEERDTFERLQYQFECAETASGLDAGRCNTEQLDIIAPHAEHFIFNAFSLREMCHWEISKPSVLRGYDVRIEAANAGWRYLEKFGPELGVDNNYFRTYSVTVFLHWGYCIWDEARLERWGLLQSPDTCDDMQDTCDEMQDRWFDAMDEIQ